MNVSEAMKIVLETFPEAYSESGMNCGFLVIGDGLTENDAWVDVATKLKGFQDRLEWATQTLEMKRREIAELNERLDLMALQDAIVRESLINTIIDMLEDDEDE